MDFDHPAKVDHCGFHISDQQHIIVGEISVENAIRMKI